MSATSRWEEYKKKNGTTPIDLLNPKTKKASADLASSRFAICAKCPDLISITNQCKNCGCFMHIKTKLEGSKCPLNKW